MNSRAEHKGNRAIQTEKALLGGVFSRLEDPHIASDGFRRDQIVACDHKHADSGLFAQLNAVDDFGTRRIFDSADAKQTQILLHRLQSADVEEFSGFEVCECSEYL